MTSLFLFWIVMMLLPLGSHAQDYRAIQGVLKTDSTHQPIGYASIYLKETATRQFVGTVSDRQGGFLLTVPLLHTRDTVTFSCVGYDTRKVTVASLLAQAARQVTVEIFLQESATLLPSLMVTNITARQMMEKCIQQIPHNYLHHVFDNHCFYWQVLKENHTVTGLREAFVVAREDYTGNPVVRTFQTDSVTRQAGTFTWRLPLDSVKHALLFDFIRSGGGAISPETMDEWNYQYVFSDHYQGQHITAIEAVRKDHFSKALLFINTDTWAVERIEFSYRWGDMPSYHLNDSLTYQMSSVQGLVLYKRTYRTYNIKHLSLTATYTVRNIYKRNRHWFREVTTEFTVLQSQELLKAESMPPSQAGQRSNVWATPVIIDRKTYCEAIKALLTANDSGRLCPE